MTRRLSYLFHAASAVLIAVVAAIFLNHTIGFALDDSYITYRYAYHLEMGYGLVFNVGEPYLGTTASGFAILLAVLHILVSALNLAGLLASVLGVDQARMENLLDIPHLARYVSAVSVGVIGITLYAFIARAFRNWLAYPFGLLLALWVISMPPVISVTGHETLPYVALVLLGLYFAKARPFLCGLLLGLATLVRPDAALAFGVAFAALALPWLARREWAQLRKAVRALVGFLLPVVPWALFAWVYYGSPIPGTLLAKQAQVSMGAWPLASYDLMSAQVAGAVPEVVRLPIMLFALFGLIIAGIRRDVAALVGLWGLAHLVAYSVLKVTFWGWYATPLHVAYLFMALYGMAALVSMVWSRGRLMPWDMPSKDARPAFSLQKVLALTASLSALMLKYARLTAIPIMALLAWVGLVGIGPGWAVIAGPRVEHQHTPSFRQVADYILAESPNGASLSTPEPGALAYFLGPKFYVLDTLGLTAPGVAAHLLVRDYEWPYLHYQPDWVLVSYRGVINPNLNKPWFKEMYAQVKEFHHPYWDAQGITLRLFRKRVYITGPNFVENGNFTRRGDGTVTGWNLPAKDVMRVELTDKGNALVLAGTEVGDNLNATQNLRLEPNKQYVVSFEYRNSVASEMQRVYIQVFDLGGGLVNTFPTGAGYGVGASAAWEKATFRFESGASGERGILILRNRGIGEAWFRNVEVRELISE